MKIHVVSDIHLELGHIPHLPGGDLLLLCGDTVVAYKLAHDIDGHAGVCETFFTKQVSKYARILVLMGNHEHYHGVIDDTPTIYRSFLAEFAPHARLLDNDVEVIDGTAFVGSTLWAPCQRNREPWVESYIGDGMNDFRLIKTLDDAESFPGVRRFTTADARARHKKAVAWIKRIVKKHGRVVVMTHHAPSLACNTKYKSSGHPSGDVLTPAYCSDLESIMHLNPHISHWLHGHTHHDTDILIGNTRVMSNQHGYWGHEYIARNFDAARGEFEIKQEVMA